jgi:hypothetical protein
MKPSSATQAWTIATVPYSGPDAFRLTRALYEEQLSTYGFADSPADTPAREYDPPHGAFFVASVGGGPAIACGGGVPQDATRPSSSACTPSLPFASRAWLAALWKRWRRTRHATARPA